MKYKKLVSTALMGSFILSAYGTTVNADVIVNSEGMETQTKITVVDTDESGVDPLDPTNPTQTHLTLDHVPTDYNFTTILSNGVYNITAGLTENPEVQNDSYISVFNDRMSREWSVKAEVVGNKITDNNNNTYDVNSFKINDIEIAETGATGIVFKSGNLDSSNTGSLNESVDSVNISFNDSEKNLKVDDTIMGTISYTLYNSANAQ